FVREGTVRYVRRYRVRKATAGDVIVFPAGSVHTDPWATRAAPVRLMTLLRPAAPEWLAFGLELGRVTRSGPLNRHGQPPLPVVMNLVQQSGADVFAAALPTAL